MKIISITFSSDAGSVSNPDHLVIRPELTAEVDQMNAKIDLEYSIDTTDVNLEIENPNKNYQMTGTEETFRKEVIFKKKNTGTKKDFALVVVAKFGTSRRRDTLSISYE